LGETTETVEIFANAIRWVDTDKKRSSQKCLVYRENRHPVSYYFKLPHQYGCRTLCEQTISSPVNILEMNKKAHAELTFLSDLEGKSYFSDMIPRVSY